MKRTILAIALASFVPAYAEDPEFAKLQKIQRDAIAKAVTPINEGYVRELRKLLERQTKAGKLDEAKVTMEEIGVITGKDESATASTTSDKDFEKFVIGTTWKHVAGSTVTFKKGGAGVKEEGNKEWPIVWRIHPPNIIEATGNFNADGSQRTFFYRIISKKESYYGDTADGATAPLVYVR